MQHENREIQKSQSVNLATNFKEDWFTALMTRSFFFFFCLFFLASDVMLSLKRDTTLNLQVWSRHQTNLNTMKPHKSKRPLFTFETAVNNRHGHFQIKHQSEGRFF